MNWFLNLFQHRHKWVDTATNPFMITTEQQCAKCGKFRHHLWEHTHATGYDWQPGRHPEGTHPSPKPKEKLCIECKHYRWQNGDRLPQCLKADTRSLVSGEVLFSDCARQRYAMEGREEFCGEGAKWFEAKPKSNMVQPFC